VPATPASPPPPGSGSFTLTPRQAQPTPPVNRRGIRKRARDRAMGPDLGLSASTHRFIYLYPGLVGLSLKAQYRISHTGDSGETCPRRLSRFPRWH
jgi:hypothetical protein